MATERFACLPLSVASADLSARAFRVLIAIRSFANGSGVCHPGMTRISEITKIDRKRLPALIREIENAGIFAIERRQDEAGDAATNLYRFKDASQVSPPEETPVPSTMDTESIQGGTGVPVQEDTVSPQKGTEGVPKNGNTVSPSEGTGGVPVYGDQTDHLEQKEEETLRAARPPPTRSLIRELWERGVAVLGKDSRSLIGKMRKRYGDPIVAEAIVACEQQVPSDPAAFFIKCCKQASEKPNGRDYGKGSHAGVVDAFAYALGAEPEGDSGGDCSAAGPFLGCG